MKNLFKSQRSGGMPVTAAVKALIKQGDAARDDLKWADASAAYRQAVKAAPELSHIWVQLGHALKESDDLSGAEKAYIEADQRLPTSDVKLHLGHLSKDMENPAAALRHYIEAYRRDSTNPDAFGELYRMISAGTPDGYDEALEVLKADLLRPLPTASAQPSPHQDVLEARDTIGRLKLSLEASGARNEAASLPQVETILDNLAAELAKGSEKSGPSSTALVFDASDLIGYYRHARLPTGIQRVQIETITRALRANDGRDVRVCCFIDGRDD